jgi:hypothetical protein
MIKYIANLKNQIELIVAKAFKFVHMVWDNVEDFVDKTLKWVSSTLLDFKRLVVIVIAGTLIADAVTVGKFGIWNFLLSTFQSIVSVITSGGTVLTIALAVILVGYFLSKYKR